MTLQYLPTQTFKYCPRCGSGKFTPDSPKSLLCADCGFQYFFNMVAAVAGLLYNDEGKLLLTYRANDPAKGELDLPGGFVDLGEDASEALKREIREELNLDIIQMEYYSSFPNEYLYGGMTYLSLDLVFNCKVSTFDCIHPADDVSGYTFIDPFKIQVDSIGLSSIKNIIRSLQKS
jgi:NAD+ diphosphatase